MKQPRFVLSGIILILIGLQCAGQPALSAEAYRCFKAQQPILIDGRLEPAWNTAAWSGPFVDIRGGDRPSPRHPTRMKMLWDEKALFIAARLEEPHLWASLMDRDDTIWYDNDFEVFIDPDGDGLHYFELEINALGTEFDLFLPKPYSKGGKADIAWNMNGLQSAVGLQGSLNDPSDTDTAWILEIAIPWEALGHPSQPAAIPQAGDTWRMNFSRVQWPLEVYEGSYRKATDGDSGKPLPEDNWVWSPQGEINMHLPEHWGFVTFEYPVEAPKFWIWIGGKQRTDAEWDRIFRELSGLGIYGALINADTAVLRDAIRAAVPYGCQVHAWFWTMNRAEASADWLSVNANGESLADHKAYVDYYKFMCPALPEVRQHLAGQIDRLAEVEGLAGIHMDYIRYVDAILPVGLQPKYGLDQYRVFPEYDYGYHPYMLRLYSEMYGKDVSDPVGLMDDPDWLQFRLEWLNRAVGEVRDRTLGHDLMSTAAVFPTPDMARRMVRQDWRGWNLDAFFPMLYHNFYNEDIDWIREMMKENRKSLPAGTRIYAGLYLPALQEGDDLTRAIRAALQGGADGVALFSLEDLDEGMKRQLRFLEEM